MNIRSVLGMLCLMSIIILSLPGISVMASTDNQVYDNIKENNEKEYSENSDALLNGDENQGDFLAFDDISLKAWNFYDSFYRMMKSIFPLAFISSIALGVIINIFARRNKSLKKFGLFGFMIGLPLVFILLVFGIPYLHGIFQ